MPDSLLVALELLRYRIGRYDYYRALFRSGINPDELWQAGKALPFSEDLRGRVQTFLDAHAA